MLKCAESVMKYTLEVIDTEEKFRATFSKSPNWHFQHLQIEYHKRKEVGGLSLCKHAIFSVFDNWKFGKRRWIKLWNSLLGKE